MNNKGNFLIGILFVSMGIILVMAFATPIEEMVLDVQQNDTFNCDDAVDYDSNNPHTNSMGCVITDLTVPLLIIGIVVAGIILVLYPQQQQPMSPMGYVPQY